MATSEVEDDRSRSGSPEDSDGEPGLDDMSEQQQNDGKSKPQNGTSSNKDPNRPRRKKARRACFACQRAHLTCGMCEVDMTCHI